MTNCVYLLADEAFYYQFLEETPRQLKSARAPATGVSPVGWKQLARESTTCVLLRHLEHADGRRAVDGRWDLLLQPWGAEARQEYQGFGVIECYENASPQADEPAYLKHPEDIAHVIRMWNPTAVSLKLDRGERVSVGEIVEAYRELEPGPLGMVMPSPESDSMTARMVAEAKVRALLVESEQ